MSEGRTRILKARATKADEKYGEGGEEGEKLYQIQVQLFGPGDAEFSFSGSPSQFVLHFFGFCSVPKIFDAYATLGERPWGNHRHMTCVHKRAQKCPNQLHLCNHLWIIPLMASACAAAFAHGGSNVGWSPRPPPSPSRSLLIIWGFLDPNARGNKKLPSSPLSPTPLARSTRCPSMLLFWWVCVCVEGGGDCACVGRRGWGCVWVRVSAATKSKIQAKCSQEQLKWSRLRVCVNRESIIIHMQHIHKWHRHPRHTCPPLACVYVCAISWECDPSKTTNQQRHLCCVGRWCNTLGAPGHCPP